MALFSHLPDWPGEIGLAGLLSCSTKMIQLNVIDHWRRSTTWSLGGRAYDDGHIGLYATGSPAAINNRAFRLSPDADFVAMIDAADEFFLSLGRGYSITVTDTMEDEELRAACRLRRLIALGDAAPAMILRRPLEPPILPIGISVQPVGSQNDISDFISVASQAHSMYGATPAESNT